MHEYDISAIFGPGQTYTFCNFRYQRWHSQSFSYLEKPRPDNGLLYVLTGKIRFESADGSVTAQPGDVVFLPKYSHYEAVILPAFGETKDYLINFDFRELPPVSQPMKLFQAAGEWYTEICREMLEKKLAGDLRPLWFQGQLYLLLDRLQNRLTHGEISDLEQRLQKARDLLSDALEMTVSQIAKSCGISESGLRSQFQKVYGCSPQQYRTDAKLRKAKFLLDATDLSIAAIAAHLQYYDEAYFCKSFRQLAGCSPKQYRNKKSL